MVFFVKDGNLQINFFFLIDYFLNYFPRKCISEILELAHDSASNGHFGINKTSERIGNVSIGLHANM